MKALPFQLKHHLLIVSFDNTAKIFSNFLTIIANLAFYVIFYYTSSPL
jgi:hypothetical protein